MEKYREHLNTTDEDLVQKKLIESDFDWKNLMNFPQTKILKANGCFFDHLPWIISAMVLIKFAMFTLGNC